MQSVLIKSFMNGSVCMIAMLVVTFTGIYGHDLWTPDEPREAAIALEMAETGNLIIPHLAGVPFIEKPPLYYIAAALSLKLFGSLIGHTAAIRLTSAFFGLGVLLMTFLITRRLWDNQTGLLAAAVLATMDGFVENFHWITSDPALSFFIVAAVWCFVEIYLGNRKKMLPVAGLFLAGSFLSKGVIGPVLAAVPWAGLAGIWLFAKKKQAARENGFVAGHLWLLLVFGVVAGAWIISLYVKGGPALWNEWFWVNQVGRFTGEAAKGHIKPGKPFYYVFQVLGYGMPWTPLIIYWFGAATGRLIKKRAVTREEIFLYVWGAGSIVLLTLPATKRGLYLVPVLPVYAIMSVVSLKQLTSKWFQWYAGLWTALCLVVITVIFILPLAPALLPETIPANVKAVLTDFNHYHVITGLWLTICLGVIVWLRKNITSEYIMVLATTGMLVSLLGAPVQALDKQKSMATDVRGFVAQIPESQQIRIAGTGFDETMLGAFYYYAGWRVSQIAVINRIEKILAGQDDVYDSLIVHRRDKRGDLCPESDLALYYPYVILSELITGDNQDRKVFRIKGRDSQ